MASIYPFRVALPDLNDILSFDDFFSSAKRKFPLYFSDGMYSQISQASILIYRIKRLHRSHTGIIACASVEDALQGRIKKHEHTLAIKADKMLKLIDERQALIKPILLTYPNVLSIDAYINRYTITQNPSFSIPFEDEEHLFWILDNPEEIETLQALFSDNVPSAYICDGHHRIQSCESIYTRERAANPIHNGNEPYNYILATYLAASEIEIHNYNRWLSSLKGLSQEEFLQGISRYYVVSPSPWPVNPQRKYELGMYIDNQWYHLALRPEYTPTISDDIRSSLDVSLLNRYVFEEVLGIEDVRTEPDLRYMEGVKSLEDLEFKVKAGKAVVAFNLYPVGLEELVAISDVHGTLPPKSTWIEPRMRNGFVAQLFNEFY